MAKDAKVVDIKEAEIVETAEPVEDQDVKAPEEETVAEVKHTVFGRIDQKILAKREAKAKKKAEKQPMDKTKKAAIIGGGIALGLGILGAVGKAALNAAARYADDGQNTGDEISDDGYPSEDIPEEPTEVEIEAQETETTNEET